MRVLRRRRTTHTHTHTRMATNSNPCPSLPLHSQDLSWQACLAIDKCNMSPCEVCQEIIHTLPFQKAIARLEFQCEEAQEGQDATDKRMQENADERTASGGRTLDAGRSGTTVGCSNLATRATGLDDPSPSAREKSRTCWSLEFCAEDDAKWTPPSCGTGLHDKDTDTKKSWLSHDVKKSKVAAFPFYPNPDAQCTPTLPLVLCLRTVLLAVSVSFGATQIHTVSATNFKPCPSTHSCSTQRATTSTRPRSRRVGTSPSEWEAKFTRLQRRRTRG